MTVEKPKSKQYNRDNNKLMLTAIFSQPRTDEIHSR